MCFNLAGATNNSNNFKIRKDICFLINNLFEARPFIKRHLFESTRVKSALSNNKHRYDSQYSVVSDSSTGPNSRAKTRCLSFLTILKKFLLDSNLAEPEGSDDTIEYLTLKNLSKMLRMDKNKRFVINEILGK